MAMPVGRAWNSSRNEEHEMIGRDTFQNVCAMSETGDIAETDTVLAWPLGATEK